MIDLTSDTEITNLFESNAIPFTCLSFIKEYMEQLRLVFKSEAFPPLGHWFFILETNDQLNLSHEEQTIFSCVAGSYCPEYIERYTFDDGSALFKIYVMLDNECSMTFFTLQGIHSAETEQWLLANAD